ERDLDEASQREPQDDAKRWRPILNPGEWATLDLAGLLTKFGVYYLPYRRLRISSTTDELARLIARLLDLHPEAAQFTAVRRLIHAWREEAYPDYHRPEEVKEEQPDKAKEAVPELAPTASQFLIDFDFQYWVRRLNFVRGKVDQLYGLIRLPARENG